MLLLDFDNHAVGRRDSWVRARGAAQPVRPYREPPFNSTLAYTSDAFPAFDGL